ARMEKLLSQVREITAISGEIRKEEQTTVDVRELLRQLVEGFRMRERDRVAFDLSLPEESLDVRASADRLLQVFENLLDNAVSFAPEVFVSASGDERFVFVRVRDRGPGIAEENMGRIFDRLFTYRPAERGRHTGLGLSIVKTIVEASGANRVRNDVFACPANVLVSTNHTIEGFINPQGVSPAERAICSVRRNALNPLHEGAESRILIWGRNQMCMIRHDHSAMKPIRDSMIVHDRVEHDVARRWW